MSCLFDNLCEKSLIVLSSILAIVLNVTIRCLEVQDESNDIVWLVTRVTGCCRLGLCWRYTSQCASACT